VQRFLGAVSARDWQRLRDCFAEDIRFRALTPSYFSDPADLQGALDQFSEWFDDVDEFELVSSTAEQAADRIRISYRMRFVHEGVRKWCEQEGYCAVLRDRISLMNLVCSGFRPDVGEPTPP
jgi:hypothetical protein